MLEKYDSYRLLERFLIEWLIMLDSNFSSTYRISIKFEEVIWKD